MIRLFTTLAATFVALVGMAERTLADDVNFFALYDQVNSADMEIAELGAIRGYSVEVRTVAVMILRDHAAVRQMARDIAQDANIDYSLPADAAMAADHAAAMAELSALSGEAFDRAYLAREVPFHRNASVAVRDVFIPSVKNDEFRSHLETVLPHFEHHLRATIEAADALGYDTE